MMPSTAARTSAFMIGRTLNSPATLRSSRPSTRTTSTLSRMTRMIAGRRREGIRKPLRVTTAEVLEGRAERTSKNNRHKPSIDQSSDAMIARDEKVADHRAHVTQEKQRIGAGQNPVGQVDPSLTGRHRKALGRRGAPHPAEAVAKIAERSRPEIGNRETIAQQIVAVELDQGHEIDDELDPGCHDDDQGYRVERGRRLRHAPRHGRDRPENELDIWSGNADPDPLGFLGKEP